MTDSRNVKKFCQGHSDMFSLEYDIKEMEMLFILPTRCRLGSLKIGKLIKQFDQEARLTYGKISIPVFKAFANNTYSEIIEGCELSNFFNVNDLSMTDEEKNIMDSFRQMTILNIDNSRETKFTCQGRIDEQRKPSLQ